MANRRRKKALTLKRLKAMLHRQYVIIGAGVLGVVLIVIVALSLLGGGDDRPAASQVAQAQPTPTPEVAVTPEPTPVQTATPEERALTRPQPTQAGYMPVFRQANTQEKIVCITVDDCYQADNLQKIVDKALEVGGKLTIFPIGKNVLLEQQSKILKYAWEQGFELENHTYSHNNLYQCSDETLAKEVYSQQMALSYILGLEYQPHFLRPMGGEARHDQRMQKYAEQLGYYGVAYWSCSGSDTKTQAGLIKALQPGAIFLFHTTNRDTEVLMSFIPYVVEQGYQLVTMNEMFGYPANEATPLETPLSEHVTPTLAPFERVYPTYEVKNYGYGVLQLQAKLIQLGYMKGKPDGIYGEKCANAIKAYQKAHGLQQTGVADPEVQRMIFAE